MRIHNNKLINRLLIIFLLMVGTSEAKSQIGGNSVYRFLEMAPSARIGALGSNFLSVNDNDLMLAYSNPALLNKEMSNNVGINYLNYFSDINSGFITYSRHIEKIGSFAGSLQFINYGDFTRTDAQGNEYETFKASEYAFTVGWAKQLSERLSVGVNLKNIWSQLDSYKSYGLGVDIGANYMSVNERFSASVVAANIGRQLSSFAGVKEPLPFNLKFGLSTKFEHAPLRLHFIADQLQQWDLTYSDPNEEAEIDPFSGEVIQEKGWDFGDKFMRHIVVGGEFVPGNGNFSVRLGYNYRRRAEMKIADRKAMVGFSWGLGFKISKFRLSYARAMYSLAGATNHFTISTNLNDFF